MGESDPPQGDWMLDIVMGRIIGTGRGQTHIWRLRRAGTKFGPRRSCPNHCDVLQRGLDYFRFSNLFVAQGPFPTAVRRDTRECTLDSAVRQHLSAMESRHTGAR